MKASITLASGAVVAIEGTTQEVQTVLSLYGPAKDSRHSTHAPEAPLPITRVTGTSSRKNEPNAESSVDLLAIVNLIKSCDEAESIERRVLDNNAQLPRVLLPLYIVNEHMGNTIGLTSGDISKILTELGVPMTVANASVTLARQSKYVMGDKVRKNGQPVRYKLSRRGNLYFQELLSARA